MSSVPAPRGGFGYNPSSARRKNAYSGANVTSGAFKLWRPDLRSADAEILRDGPDLRARARDLERNHPFATGVVRTSRLGVIGKHFRYSCRPDWRYLGIDRTAAIDWATEWEFIWEEYAHGIDLSFDAGRRMDFTRLMSLVHDHDYVDGEYLIGVEWDESRRWNTCFQVIDVDRLSNPHGGAETPRFRGGVELGRFGEPLAYHVRSAHPSDHSFTDGRALQWDRIERATSWGRPIILHGFEVVRAGQTRGRSHFAPVINAMKMGSDYMETALQSAILQASYAAVVESQANHQAALDAIGMSTEASSIGKGTVAELATEHLEATTRWHEEISFEFQGAKVPVLYPGEKLNLMTPGNTAANLGDFQAQMARAYASGTGTDSIAVSGDYSKVNYSSAKMAAATTYRGFETRRQRLVRNAAMPMVAAALEEAIFTDAVKMPKGIDKSQFYAAREALMRGTFLAQGAPNLDPTKEAAALRDELELGLTTIRDACAERGLDWREVMEQRASEKDEMKALGVGDPMWQFEDMDMEGAEGAPAEGV